MLTNSSAAIGRRAAVAKPTICCLALVAAIPWLSPAFAGTPTLTLEAAVHQALAADPWLTGSRENERALREEAVAAAALPDPLLSLGAMNLPVNSFDVGQENMTQLALGISQQFPRGRTRSLARRQKEALAAMEPMLRADRQARLREKVASLYLDAFLADASHRLIENDRALFEQLVDAAEARYATAVGRARQQDLIRAQLELTRLDDRLTLFRQQQETAQRRLVEFAVDATGAPLQNTLPELEIPATADQPAGANRQALFDAMQSHPALLAAERQIESIATGVDLARQKYRPGWGLSAQYGYRAEDPAGRDRDDLLSVGLTIELPLFRSNRQDREVNAAMAREASAWTGHTLLVRQLVAELDSALVALIRENERLALYESRLLPQMSQQAEASLAAYNNADGDFDEAVRARIAELDSKIEALAIGVSRQQIRARIGYLLTRAPEEPEAPGQVEDGGERS